ncbi:MAG: PaaI family thioesterase [Syntrophaceae bacterium]|nr:PaaI family thioesterase [Syntrophaceae bacterium]
MNEMLMDLERQEEVNLHRNCFACGSNNGIGLGLKFYKKEGGTVFGNFYADPKYEGYSGVIHGGIIATLLDSVMTHCLLMENIPAFTGRLLIKYSAPIRTGRIVRLEARIVGESRRVFTLEGKAFVEGKKVASAKARYMRPGPHHIPLDSQSVIPV